MQLLISFCAVVMFLISVSHADQSSSQKPQTHIDSIRSTVNIDSALIKLFGDRIPEKLTSDQAAQLACELANTQCHITFDTRPFSPSTFKANLNQGRWQWGYFDVAGLNGYSAKVSFNAEGRDPKVDVYFSYDSRIRDGDARLRDLRRRMR